MNNILKLILIISVFMIGCDKKKEGVTFNIKNDKVLYCLNLDSLEYYNFSFPNEKYRNFSVNVLEVEVENKTEDKQLLFLKDVFLDNLDFCNIKITDDNKNKVILEESLINKHFENDSLLDSYIKEYELKELQYSKKENEFDKIGFKKNLEIDNFNLYNHFIVLNPNENFTFKYLYKFPFLIERDEVSFLPVSFYPIKSDKKYHFEIEYKFDKKNIRFLPNYLKEDLKRNKIKIYTDSIFSNRVLVENLY